MITKNRFAALVLLLALVQCSSVPMVYVESTNQSSRIDYIVLHATSENFAESLRLLTTRNANPVSSHYLLPTLDDASYPRDDLRVFSLVDESQRAWHAGVSYWEEEESLNDRSIGIEIVNELECTGANKPVDEIVLEEVVCEFEPYPDEQIDLLIKLLADILQRYPRINPIDIVGHSDIAIMRRSDPGPMFPWQRLYEAGIGAWPDADATARYSGEFGINMPTVRTLQRALLGLGYQVKVTGELDVQTRFAVRAFQLHYRPADFSG